MLFLSETKGIFGRIMPFAFAAILAGSNIMMSNPAFAQDANQNEDKGKFQVKLFGTAVLPNGEITEILVDNIGLPADAQTRANDNIVPTVALEYFPSDNFSIETICCISQHDVDGVAGIAGIEAISDAIILPATVTAKYHFSGINGVRPYVGAGPSYFFYIDEQPGAQLAELGAVRTVLNSEVGIVFQAGLDADLNDKGLILSADVKRYISGTTATWFDANGDILLQTDHAIDPWVISVGVGYRF